MTDLSHIEGLIQGEQKYYVLVHTAGMPRKTQKFSKGMAESVAEYCRSCKLDAEVKAAEPSYLCPLCSFPLDKVWKDATQTEVDHLSCRNDDCRWNSKDRLQHPRKKEEGTGRKSATWGT